MPGYLDKSSGEGQGFWEGTQFLLPLKLFSVFTFYWLAPDLLALRLFC